MYREEDKIYHCSSYQKGYYHYFNPKITRTHQGRTGHECRDGDYNGGGSEAAYYEEDMKVTGLAQESETHNVNRRLLLLQDEI